MPIQKEYPFDTDEGPKTLPALFDGRSQLIVYHFMFGPAYTCGHRLLALTGHDVSYPQCGTAFPASPAFAGVNGGLANNLNSCLGPSSSYPSYQQAELYWAVAASTGATSQPKASLYLNTADPGCVYNGAPIADWPAAGSTP